MDSRVIRFCVIAFAILAGSQLLFQVLGLNQPRNAQQPADVAEKGEENAAAPKAENAAKTPEPPANINVEAAPPDAEPVKPAPAKWVTIGSVDPVSNYRMLVTLTSAGAAIERIELSGPRYSELEDDSGYLGHLAETDVPNGGGALVNVVGAGTPAEAAAIVAGDIITSINDEPVAAAIDVPIILKETKPGDTIPIVVKRGDQSVSLSAILRRHPMEVIRPELDTQALKVVEPGRHDPFSLLTTLQQVGDAKVAGNQNELAGVDLLNGHWEIDNPADQVVGTPVVTFLRRLPQYSMEIVKRYTLAQAPDDSAQDENYPAYNLTMEIEIRNLDQQARQFAYQLYGPTGLPTEGWWYATRITPGLRDVVTQFPGVFSSMTTQDVAAYDKGLQGIEKSPAFMGVDGQYFASVVIPQYPDGENWFSQWEPLAAGQVPTDKYRVKLTDVSFRLITRPLEIAPGGSLKHEYVVFAGPKRPDLLAHYGPPASNLSLLIDYGWFDWVAVPMLWILHSFYSLVGNYGIAIVLLTVVVRGCLFPLSRKQAMSAQVMQQKMAEMGPEMKKINEKHKGNAEARAREMQALWRKHDYHPAAMMGGCLLMFLQLPIFIGLYRSLMVDVELRQAPLISESVRWCSNLGAPDMLFNWEGWMPQFLAGETGWLGPYFNILPMVTVGLFLWQQKMFMPPPTDEQTAMQQKVMQYMMIVIAFMFFKVASGLCIYFIASSLWGITERKLLPKPTPTAPKPPEPAGQAIKVGAAANSSGASRKKNKGKK